MIAKAKQVYSINQRKVEIWLLHREGTTVRKNTYVGLSIATLLSQRHHVTAVDIIPEKVELINNKKSPIQTEYIEKLDLTATLDAKEAYSDADFVVIAAPTNVYPKFSVA